MAAAKAAANQGYEWGLTWYFQWGIYRSIPTWTHSQNSLAAAEALCLKISPMEHLSNDHEDHPNQDENSHKLCNETGHPVVNMMPMEDESYVRWKRSKNEAQSWIRWSIEEKEVKHWVKPVENISKNLQSFLETKGSSSFI